MNRRRSISIVVLAALLLAQALPARAGAMLCPMKKGPAPISQVACARCEAPAASESNGVLRSRSCCKIEQGEARDATPIILTTTRRAVSFEPQNLLVAPLSLLAGSAPPDPVRAIAWSGPPPVSLLASSIPSTILRN